MEGSKKGLVMGEQMIHLHNHSDYSNERLIDSINKIEDLVKRAVELGNKGVALTDHETLSGHVSLMRYVTEGKKNGTIPKDFKLILGNEIYLVDEIQESIEGKKFCDKYYHFILLAKDEIGHKQLRELSSIAWVDNYFRTGLMERVPTLKKDLKRIVSAEPGHLIFSTACIGSEIGQRLLAIKNNSTGDLPFTDGELIDAERKKNEEKIEQYIQFCKDLAGEDFYLEIQPNNSEEQSYVNKQILALSRKHNIPLIITSDSHYLRKEDREIHKAYLNSHEEEREVDDFYTTAYMMDIDEIHEYLDPQIGAEEVSKALANTLLIGEKVKEYDLFHTQIVPKTPIPKFELNHTFSGGYEQYPYIKKFAYSENEYDRYFLYLIEEGWYKKEYRKDLTKEEVHKMASRINEELEAIWEISIKIKDNVSAYYISAREIVNMMWDDSENGGNSLVGCGRGSVGAFYVAYLVGIQEANSLKHNIPYWRHLHKSRPEMPD